FGAELIASGFVAPPLPVRDSTEKWIELFNRGGNAVDVTGWTLAGGIDFSFPTNTTIPAGGYLVIADDVPLIQAKYPAATVLGPIAGNLSGSSDRILLKDAAGNPADEVEYHDDRPWPGHANGFGSSLELRDARADNSRPEAWAASDHSGESTWNTYLYRGIATVEPAASPTQWNEFVMGLLGEGEVWLDDVSVLEAPTGIRRQLLQNGKFENGSSTWRTIGNHRLSQVIEEPGNPANHILRLVATGDTEHRHNQANTTYTNNLTIVNGTEYEISFRARWIAGSSKLNTRLYFNRLARTTDLVVPESQGTPGAVNSRAVANAGPTFAKLRHEPIVPLNSQSAVVSVDATDPDNVNSATLFYSVNGGTWQNSVVTISNTPLARRLIGTIPPQTAGALVQFYFSATDGLGAVAMYPAGGTNSRALYKVSTGAALSARLQNIRLLMTAADVNQLHASTNVMSNEPWGCTVVYNDREVFYDTTLHLQASERGRNDSARVGFTVSLPADHLLRGVEQNFTIDRSGGYTGANPGGRQNEILLKHAVNKAGGLPGMYDDLAQVFTPRSSEDGTAILILAKYGDEFLDTAFENGGDGEMYKLELIYYPTTTAVAGDPQAPKLPQPDGVIGTDIKDLGPDQEAYRHVYLKDNHVSRDDYGPMMNFARVMSLTGTNFDTQIRQVMDVDEWMRAVAYITLIGGTDIYTYGNSHNLVMYIRPQDQKAMALLWDMDFSFTAAATAGFPGTGSPNTTKLFANPDNNRRYYNHLYDLASITGDSAYLSRWASHYAGMVGQNWQPAVDYLAQRAAFVRTQMPLATPFAIANNGGNNFATSSNTIALNGTAAMNVRDIEVNGIRYTLTWTSLTNWTLTLPLPGNTNLVSAQAYDGRGNRLTNVADSIVITNLSVPALLPVVINEWMADNAGPGGVADPLDTQFQDWFELYNPNNAPVNLSGYYLTDTLLQPTTWTIPANTIIPAKGFLLVWADDEATQNGFDSNGHLHAAFKLSTGGEDLGLFAPDGTRQHGFTFPGQFQNVSQGLFPDGNTNAVYRMTNWTPRAANKLDALPAPIIETLIYLNTNQVILGFTSAPGRIYRVDYKFTLGNPTWLPLANRVATNGVTTLTDNIAGFPQRFYRVVLLQ
ncbi:MAG TPA: lamin tail domain-containing protein, partial [Candidatus Acidoferrum sp.]|nr:lamin tail domain-containing protein [Candidatus Acidoferrum sp.]